MRPAPFPLGQEEAYLDKFLEPQFHGAWLAIGELHDLTEGEAVVMVKTGGNMGVLADFLADDSRFGKLSDTSLFRALLTDCVEAIAKSAPTDLAQRAHSGTRCQTATIAILFNRIFFHEPPSTPGPTNGLDTEK